MLYAQQAYKCALKDPMNGSYILEHAKLLSMGDLLNLISEMLRLTLIMAMENILWGCLLLLSLYLLTTSSSEITYNFH